MSILLQTVLKTILFLSTVNYIQNWPSIGQGDISKGYDNCTADGAELNISGSVRLFPQGAGLITCSLTGMVPEFNHQIQVYSQSGLISDIIASTDVGDERPEAGDTSPIMFAIGAITLSLIALLGYARYRDGQLGRTKSRLAHFYIAPAMLALAILTFYPVMYGIWLSFTDADQTHLGEQAFIGLSNFWDVISASGFIRVTIFTIIWTVVNVTAHIGIGLFLALILQRSNIKGKPRIAQFYFFRGRFRPISLY